MTAYRRRRPHGDRGSAALELLGVIPVVVVVLLLLVQVCAAGYTVLATNQAVRDGARAHSLGQSVPTAVDHSLPGGLDAERVEVAGDTVLVEVRVPRVAVLPTFTVTREAAMPRTDR